METTSRAGRPFHQTANQIRRFIEEVESYYMLERARPYGIERRDVERTNVTMPVQITALDNHLNPLAYQYHGITRDISPKGIGLVATNPVGLTYVTLNFQPYYGESFTAVGKVIRCDEIGYYFTIGCEFVVD